jgi:hypothetical protein
MERRVEDPPGDTRPGQLQCRADISDPQAQLRAVVAGVTSQCVCDGEVGAAAGTAGLTEHLEQLVRGRGLVVRVKETQ